VPSAWRSSSSKRCLCGGPRLHAARSVCGKVLQSERAGCAEDRPDSRSQRGAFVCLFWVPAVTLRRSSFACRMIRGSVCRRTPGGTQGTHGYSRVLTGIRGSVCRRTQSPAVPSASELCFGLRRSFVQAGVLLSLEGAPHGTPLRLFSNRCTR
jgi:hypothetical protein